MLKVLISRVVLLCVKLFSHLFFRTKAHFQSPMSPQDWNEVRLMVFLNHTSLFEPIFCTVLPWSFLWKLARYISLPGAAKTLERPIVGKLWKLMLPNIHTITRKRDNTWTSYLESIKETDIIMIAPEGRMKRKNGLDADGKPMSVRGGIVEILEKLQKGKILFCHSHGLHHVQAPGEFKLRLFQTIAMDIDCVDVQKYKNEFSKENFKAEVISNLEKRIKRQS
jgi:hypothetical protein